jgi:hypothetical protein
MSYYSTLVTCFIKTLAATFRCKMHPMLANVVMPIMLSTMVKHPGDASHRNAVHMGAATGKFVVFSAKCAVADSHTMLGL